MTDTNYNYIETKTSLKGILKIAPSRKNTSKASQNVFLRFYCDLRKFAVIESIFRTVFTN